MQMVQQAYPPVYRHKSFEFGEARAADGRIAQRVHIVDDNGEAWEACTRWSSRRRQFEDHGMFAIEGGTGGIASRCKLPPVTSDRPLRSADQRNILRQILQRFGCRPVQEVVQEDCARDFRERLRSVLSLYWAVQLSRRCASCGGEMIVKTEYGTDSGRVRISMGTAAKKTVRTSRKEAGAKTDARHDDRPVCGAAASGDSTRSRKPACACRSRSISRTRRSPKTYEDVGIDNEFTTPWEPGLRDGPTSARFAVVDYDSTSNTLTPPPSGTGQKNCYLRARRQDRPRSERRRSSIQFHQLSVWATVQNTLDYFESGFGARPPDQLGVRGQPADRRAACRLWRECLLRPGEQVAAVLLVRRRQGHVYTCLSSDIVNHEFGHAVLDGLRPHIYESVGARDRGISRVPRRPHRDPDGLPQQCVPQSSCSKESNGDLDQMHNLLAGLAQRVRRGGRRTRPICAAR